MAFIESLTLAPAKSFRSCEDIESLQVDSRGLFGDRDYMAVEADVHVNQLYMRKHVAGPGHFLSQREDPVLTSIIPKLLEDGVLLSADGQESLSIPAAEDTATNRRPVSVHSWSGEAVDQGDEAAEWLSEIIKRPVRLVAISDEEPRYVENDPALGRVGFADAYAMTVASTTSFALLSQTVEQNTGKPMPKNRTRTTIELGGLVLPETFDVPENAFPEDYIETIRIADNGLVLVLHRRKACGRCPIPDTDQLTSERKGRPVLAALHQLGRHGHHLDRETYGNDAEVFMSQNLVEELPEDMPPNATIAVRKGAEVEVTYTNQTNWVSKV